MPLSTDERHHRLSDSERIWQRCHWHNFENRTSGRQSGPVCRRCRSGMSRRAL